MTKLSTSLRLSANIKRIMDEWEVRALKEISSAHHQESLALRNSLPEYLAQLVDALSKTINRTDARILHDKTESTRVGKKHGKERAGSLHYTMDQMIMEYHILRQTVCDVLEEEAILTPVEREVIVCSIEQAVNDAATQFSDTLKDVQEQLSHTLAHDLRNPISIAKMCAQMIHLKTQDEDCQNKSKRISHSMDRLDKMIRDLLDASRIRAGQGLPITFDTCDLHEIILEVVNDSSLVHADRFAIDSCGSCMGIWDKDGLRRLIENLASNAIKHGSAAEPVTIYLTQTETTATVSVHNKGPPIPEEEIPLLFEKFHRSRSAENKIGWGIGLSMVKGMVNAHNGLILVESHLEDGTIFVIELPKDPQKASF
ncbi:MAG TPA: HAMP domain-containing sensor histidine kinase [Bacteriovoracaceae bacterium]|nr:HAMP domain-containing sensor histidine kinase [Bacteriovoracaceae bacterium]